MKITGAIIGDADDKFNIYANSNAYDSRAWIEMFGSNDPAREGEMAIAGTYLSLRSNSTDAGYGSEVVRISSGGNVGVGTSSPGEQLDVQGNIEINGTSNNVNDNGGMLTYENTSGLGGGTAKKVERHTRLNMNSYANYAIYEDQYVTLAIERYYYNCEFYVTLKPKSGYAGYWNSAYDDGGYRNNCNTSNFYRFTPDIGVGYTGGVEVILNREDDLSTPTYRVWPHLHDNQCESSVAMSVIVEAYYP